MYILFKSENPSIIYCQWCVVIRYICKHKAGPCVKRKFMLVRHLGFLPSFHSQTHPDTDESKDDLNYVELGKQTALSHNIITVCVSLRVV